MIEAEQTPGGRDSLALRTMMGKEKLEQLKARFFPPETQVQRVARAMEGLRIAVKPSKLDPATLKYIAQSADLEGV